jgi:hypothetical protein
VLLHGVLMLANSSDKSDSLLTRTFLSATTCSDRRQAAVRVHIHGFIHRNLGNDVVPEADHGTHTLI